MRALTEQVYVDEAENDEEGLAEMLMDDNAIATVARPGTSLAKPNTAVIGGPSAAMRSGCCQSPKSLSTVFSVIVRAVICSYLEQGESRYWGKRTDA